MPEERFNFFLDEMIKLHNRRIIQELEHSGQMPYTIPRDVLLADDMCISMQM
jgi:hypothetical protein